MARSLLWGDDPPDPPMRPLRGRVATSDPGPVRTPHRRAEVWLWGYITIYWWIVYHFSGGEGRSVTRARSPMIRDLSLLGFAEGGYGYEHHA